MATVKLAIDCPRELAAGLELIAIADGVDRSTALKRIVAAEVGRAGLLPALGKLARRRR